MKKKILKKVSAMLLFFSMIISSTVFDVNAAAPNGIYGNGTGGIYIDINAAPYTTYANKAYGGNAYTAIGCAWFASARAYQITGIDTAIWSGKNWYNSAYSYYGYSRGATLQAKALACYESHIAVVETVNGDTVTVSEGGYTEVSASNGYCIIHTLTKSQLESARGGRFLGYVYLPSSTLATPTLVSATADFGNVTIKWNTVSGATGYRIFRKDEGGTWGDCTVIGDVTDTLFKDTTVENGKTYTYTVRAYRGTLDEAKANIYSSLYWSGHDSIGVTATYDVLDTPTLVSAVNGNGYVTVKWNAVNGATGYRIFRKDEGETWGNCTLVEDITDTSFKDTTVEAGKTYLYTVRARRGILSAAIENRWDTAYWSNYDSTGLTITAVRYANNPFVDVYETGYYYDAVLWAVENGITKGTTATTFSPDNTCTRSEIVTFLWRTAGSPEPKTTENPFVDVEEGSFYYKAVLWAVENGITMGTGASKFSPAATCTRSQIVTFLWRAEGSPNPKTLEGAFADVTVGSFYEKAVLWAVENEITKGTSQTTFAPEKGCTRAEVVTFLYRAEN